MLLLLLLLLSYVAHHLTFALVYEYKKNTCKHIMEIMSPLFCTLLPLYFMCLHGGNQKDYRIT